ncbi:MAG TPA: SurA N-terminal domain-containing protein [Xanthobacteraceae bacterium]|jgi:peptidyl-prolyl cis-trans isomerase SurA
MRKMPMGSAAMRRLVVAVALAAACAQPAFAQQVAVLVNGSPITTYDIEQRIKFTILANHKTPTRQEVIEELIDEKLKVQVGQRYKLEVTDEEVDNAYASMGQKMHLTAQQLTQTLAQNGVDAITLKSRIRSDIAWQQIVRGKFQSSLQVNEKAIHEKLESGNKDDKNEVGYEYTLRPILFIVPTGSPDTLIESRKHDAEALRSRFQGCDSGLAFARALRDVAVRDQIVKSSADLAPAYRKLLDDTEVGKLTSPDVTARGVEMFALCARKENRLDSAAKKEVRDEMFAEQFQAKSKRFLADLRKGAMIEVK